MPGIWDQIVRIRDWLVDLLDKILVRKRRPRFLPLPAVELFVGNHGVEPNSGRFLVLRYPGGANGNVAPTSRFFTNNVTAVSRDGQGNLYVASDTGNQVQVYPPNAVDLTPPIRNLQGAATMLHRPTGLVVDGQGNLYVAERGGPTNPSAVLKFAPGATGSIAPIAVIPSRLAPPSGGGAANTQMDIACGVDLDYDGTLYVVTSPEPQRGGQSAILRFAPGSNGDVAPVAVITTGLSSPQQVALDGNGNLHVTNKGSASVAVYAPEPTANVPPTKTITSADLGSPSGIAVDGRGVIFVADVLQQSVVVFDPAASGLSVPLRKIQGANTQLSQPLGLTLRTI
jgi:sugar lactone lactonase YvrE